jgi:hypothetical protein
VDRTEELAIQACEIDKLGMGRRGGGSIDPWDRDWNKQQLRMGSAMEDLCSVGLELEMKQSNDGRNTYTYGKHMHVCSGCSVGRARDIGANDTHTQTNHAPHHSLHWGRIMLSLMMGSEEENSAVL